MPQPASRLVRVIGRWSLAALMLNTMIGGGVFGLPSLLAAHLASLSVAGYLVAAAGVGVIAACLAEVASQFREAGGPYLYSRVAFGPFVAIQIGWLTWLSRIAAVSAAADLFVSYLGQFSPIVERGVTRALVLVLLLGFLVIVNYRGVSAGTRLSNVLTMTKLLVVIVFIGGGLLSLASHTVVRITPAQMSITASDWFEAVLLMTYAYGGFESALIVAGETRDPRKDGPISLLVALLTATVLYMGVQYVVIHTVPNSGATATPAADAAGRFWGSIGASLIVAGTLVSIYGYLGANMLHTPRLTFAMGEQREFPSLFAAVHPRFRTPYVSIVAFAMLLVVFSVAGSYRWNVTLAAVSRLFIYGAIAAALPVLRRKRPNADAFRLPGGTLFAIVALAFIAALVTRMDFRGFAVVASSFILAGLNWFWVRSRPLPSRAVARP